LHADLSPAGVCALEAEEESLERVVGGEVEGEGDGEGCLMEFDAVVDTPWKVVRPGKAGFEG